LLVGKSKLKYIRAARPDCVSPGPSPRLSDQAEKAGKPANGLGNLPRPLPLRPAIIPLLAELISRGDGTFVLKPKVPAQDLDTWVTIPQAGEVIGCVNAKTVYGLLGEYLVYRKPLRRKILVSLKSAMALKQATQDAEFWDNPLLRQRFKDQVRRAMQQLADSAMRGFGE
jgi:hypothetical protein